MNQGYLFADGGTIGSNPSKYGGVLAACLRPRIGNYREHVSAYLWPSDAGVPEVSNNLAGLAAVLMGMKELPPDRWDGTICTDSSCTYWRPKSLKQGVGMLTRYWTLLRNQCKRLGRFKMLMVGGHPSSLEVERGLMEDGRPVFPEHTWCDEECQRLVYEAHARGLSGDLPFYRRNPKLAVDPSSIFNSLNPV